MAFAFIWTLVSILFLLGMAGVFIPGLPGLGLIFLGILFYALVTNFASLTPTAVITFGLITAIATLADYYGSAIGARLAGGKWWALVGSIAGAIIGVLVAGPPGLFIGAYVGALLGALYEGQTPQRAARTAAFAIIGLVGATFVQLVVALSLIITFLLMIVF